MQDKDERLLRRIQSSIATVQAWDADPSLLAECRALIPVQKLMPPVVSDAWCHHRLPPSVYARDDDYLYEGNALLLKRLTLFFQKDVMTWVNSPVCWKCASKDMESKGVRGPQTTEEREGGASRVEGKGPKSPCSCLQVESFDSFLSHGSTKYTSAIHVGPKIRFPASILSASC